MSPRAQWEDDKMFWIVAQNEAGETLYQNNGPTWVLALDAGDQPACRVISQVDAALWLLGIKQQDAQALTLLAGWENETPGVFAKRAILARLEGSRDDLNTVANFRDGEERVWGAKFHSQVEALAPKGGW